jgi:hypothetical protein
MGPRKSRHFPGWLWILICSARQLPSLTHAYTHSRNLARKDNLRPGIIHAETYMPFGMMDTQDTSLPFVTCSQTSTAAHTSLTERCTTTRKHRKGQRWILASFGISSHQEGRACLFQAIHEKNYMHMHTHTSIRIITQFHSLSA